MGRKVLISFLGTGNYFPVYYTWKNNNGKEKKATKEQTRFVQEAIVTQLCKGWAAEDCIMVFRTDESDKANWLDKTMTQEDGTITTIRGLKSTLENIRFANGERLRCQINPDTDGNDSYIIPMGLEAAELDDIFQCVFAKLDEDDEIYFDVTHAFRTIPLFATTLFNYARFLKGTAIKGIYYGAFEKLGPAYLLNKLPEEKKRVLSAPIADLTNIVRLQEINTAASNFRDFGNMSAFSKLMLNNSETDTDIKNISNALENLNTYMNTCQLDAIEEGLYMTTIQDNIANFCENPLTTEAQRTLLRKISKQLEKYGFTADGGYENIEAAIDWAIHYRMIQQAYTMVKEYIITRVYDMMAEQDLIYGFATEIGIDPEGNNFNYEIRNKIGNLITNKPTVMEISPTAVRFRAENPIIAEINPFYKNIRNHRNHLNHASLENDDTDLILQSLETNWNECKNILPR